MATVKRKPRMEIAYGELKASIASGRLKPGAMIRENALSEVLGMSRTPIREAVRRLESEGLVEVRDGVGTFVTEFSPEDIADAYEVRRSLELLALRTAIYAFQPEELDFFARIFRELHRKLSEGIPVTIDECAESDWMFHNKIIDKSKNRFVKKSMESIQTQVKRYQYLSVNNLRNMEQCMKEHLYILEAIRKRDLEEASQLLKEHIEF